MPRDSSSGPMPPGSGGAGDPAPGLIVVWCLAALAGWVDACGVMLLKDVFISFMSGNTTSLGLALAGADWQRTVLLATVVTTFVCGAAIGTVVAVLAGRGHLPIVILYVGNVLAVPLVFPSVAIEAMTFAMGMLNAAMQHAGPVRVSVTYVTGTLVKFGQGVGQLLCGRLQDWNWLLQTVPWTGLLAGVVGAMLLKASLGDQILYVSPAAAILLAVSTAVLLRRTKSAPGLGLA